MPRAAEPLTHPVLADLDLPEVLHALADPVRLRIVRELEAHGAQPCGAIALPVTKSTASHHFRVLREAGIVEQRDDGTRRLTTLRRADLDQRFPGLLDVVLREA